MRACDKLLGKSTIRNVGIQRSDFQITYLSLLYHLPDEDVCLPMISLTKVLVVKTSDRVQTCCLVLAATAIFQ